MTPASFASQLSRRYFSDVLTETNVLLRLRADAVDGGDDHNGDAHRNQGIFDRRRARLIAQKISTIAIACKTPIKKSCRHATNTTATA